MWIVYKTKCSSCGSSNILRSNVNYHSICTHNHCALTVMACQTFSPIKPNYIFVLMNNYYRGEAENFLFTEPDHYL